MFFTQRHFDSLFPIDQRQPSIKEVIDLIGHFDRL